MSSLAAQAARLQVTVKQVEEVYVNTIKALTQAMDARDAYTRFHSSRVSRISQAFARHLHLAHTVRGDVLRQPRQGRRGARPPARRRRHPEVGPRRLG